MNFFTRLESELSEAGKAIASFDEAREDVIRESRKILKDSKKAVFLIHDSSFSKAKRLIEACELAVKRLRQKHGESALQRIGAFSESCQEFVESVTLFNSLRQLREKDGLLEISLLGLVSPQDYVMGVSDTAGELVRTAVRLGIKNNIEGVAKTEELVRMLYEKLLGFTGYAGELRKKIDSVKWSLSKIEDILFQLKTR
ncbi:MAG TPA: hypothetical protein ENN46_02950 [Candidatus Woesearchaeota archaeon]|nr:hypothetical protein [Candidatus Woesearchaeota archaeon]